MKRWLWIAGVVVLSLVLVIGIACGGDDEEKPQTTPAPQLGQDTVQIKGFAFNPETITIDRGDSVVWTNQDSVAHTVTGSEFESGSLSGGRSYTRTFDQAGEFPYFCRFHPYMEGSVTVR